MVECQLPKLDVVGSSPIARSIFPQTPTLFETPASRCPILRAFCFIALFWGIVPRAHAQVTLDAERPFGLGEVIILPGSSDYLGDVPHETEAITDPLPYHSLEGMIASQVGWLAPPSAPNLGLHAYAPGLLFDEIPYPFESSSILDWLPAGTSFTVLNFPSSAWWGPSAAAGAVQLKAPGLSQGVGGKFSAWGGDPLAVGGYGSFHSPSLAFCGDYRHSTGGSKGVEDSFYAASKIQWFQDDSAGLESGLLGAQRFLNDDWYLAYTNFRLSILDFQTLQLKPYYQTATLGGQRLQEAGGRLDYLFNMAGLAESHWGMGWSRDDLSTGGGAESFQRGYFQNTEFFDILGSVTVDMAFRWDFSSNSATLFSALIGAQYNEGAFSVMGDYAKGRPEFSIQDIRQWDAGLRYQIGEEWNLTGKYVGEEAGQGPLNGVKWGLQADHRSVWGAAFSELKFDLEEEALADGSGNIAYDTGGNISVKVLRWFHLWMKGRGFSNTPFYYEIGGDCPLDDGTRVYVSAANLSQGSTPWPEPLGPDGSVFWVGLESKF